MYPFEMLLGLMFLFWAAAIWATFKEDSPNLKPPSLRGISLSS